MTSTTTPAAVQLGPQTAELLAAAARIERLPYGSPEGQRYAEAVDADYDAIQAVERRAEEALDADGIDVAAVCDLGGCMWGHVALALAARHLIGQAPGWTQAEYDTLTRAWALALGPLHPADA
ncbi:hypothetical protein ABGB12_34835 [Actinocorallia sp. B10E7]|uniref:hypothetical protein n=1 Tax=Actinocorallia sp. B10E7 TaxID=3153558 RepID=UPI00325F0B19